MHSFCECLSVAPQARVGRDLQGPGPWWVTPSPLPPPWPCSAAPPTAPPDTSA